MSTTSRFFDPVRRDLLLFGLSATALSALPILPAASQPSIPDSMPSERINTMGIVKTKDDVEIFTRTGVPATLSRSSFTMAGR